ncbi:MAG TPA: PilN domain-containing protein [Candidatus Saccharimonadales bacterium]|nr:PilN domain-containing protein [Candidatus Saccharimonadales bacterium]
MSQSINLIPQQEKQEQVNVQLVEVSTVVAIAVFVVVGLISGYLFYQSKTIKDKIAAHEVTITDLRSQIQSKSDIEIIARNLSAKSKVLSDILSSRIYNSMLLKEFQSRLPASITIEDFSLVGNTEIDLSGSADTYITIAKFINLLTDKKFIGGDPALQNLFTSVSLNSVTAESAENRIKFFIAVTYDNKALLKK